MVNPLIEDTISYAKGIFENDFGGHDFFHTMRVFKIATKIAEAEGANLITVQLAALLHDVDDKKLSPSTFEQKERATSFLKNRGVADKEIAQICRIIGEVSFSENGSTPPSTLEGKCVQDADRLDAMGAIGIARTFAFGGNNKRPMYNSNIPLEVGRTSENSTSSIEHFYDKLLLLKDLMNTKTGMKYAEKRDKYMREFLDEFYYEINGEC